MTETTREQFEVLSDLKVMHRPTGATFSTYRYEDPEDACSQMIENLRSAGDRQPNGDDYEVGEIRALAIRLLREQARAAATR